MIEPGKHEALQLELTTVIADRIKVEEELGSVKKEMQELIDSLDNGQLEMTDLQAQLLGVTEENEEFRHRIDALNWDLSVAEATLKDRTKELLALERELLRQKKRVAVVKDTIPCSSPQWALEAPMYGMPCLPEDVRTGLVKMQDKLMRSDSVF
jgi:chromosome segregation ATPase